MTTNPSMDAYRQRLRMAAQAELGENDDATVTGPLAFPVRVVPATTQTEVPDEPSAEAFYGLLGDLSALASEYVESDRTTVLVQMLAAFGIAAGTQPHFMVGATRHAPALYTAHIGRSSRGRKGTSWEPVEVLFRAAEPEFADRVMSGIGSGENLVHLVRDGEGEDNGAADRRLLLRESELARLLVIVNREGSTLSPYLREAFDGKPIRNLVKGRPAQSTTHHIGLVGHCTADEVRATLKEAQIRNGLANRMLWTISRRARKMPNPPVFSCADDDRVNAGAARLRDAILTAKTVRRMTRSRVAATIWDQWYEALPDDGAGLVASVTERAEALVTRLSMIYALTDGTNTIEAEHLCAALALWDYSVRCVEHIWGGTTGDVLADRLLEELVYGPLMQTEIGRDIFGGNIRSDRVEEIGRQLERQGRIVRQRIHTGERGRPPIRWELAPDAPE